MEHEFPLGTFRPEKQDYLINVPLLPEIMFRLLSNQIFRKLFVNSKQPMITKIGNGNCFCFRVV